MDGASASAGPLHRTPFVLKDVWDTADIPTTGGSYRHRDRVPAVDGDVYAAFRDAGAVLLGKSNLSDGCWTPESNNALFGPTSMPEDLSRTSGGSTGGAAAVADGMAAFDWGSDLGGSIRLPAAFCGIVGLRLSASHWPPEGHFPEVPRELELNSMGPLTTSIADCERVLSAVAPRLRKRAPERADFDQVVLLEPDAFSAGGWPQFARDARALLAAAGVTIAPTHPLPTPREIDRTFAWWLASHLGRWSRESRVKRGADLVLSLALGSRLARPAMHEDTARVLAKLTAARLLVYRDGQEARRRVAALREAAARVWEGGRLMISPATTFEAPPHGKALLAQGIAAFAKLGNVIDATALVLPFGRYASGLPRAIQILGPPGHESAVLALGARLEACIAQTHDETASNA